MADTGGIGTSLEVSVTSIDTRIPCNPDSVRDVAAWFYEAYSKVGDAVVEMSGNLLRNPEYWMGETANVYEEMLNKLRKSADDLSDRHYRAYEVLRAYAQQLDYHYRGMETIRNQAETAGLKIENDYDIMCPPPLPPKPQEPPQGTPIEDWWAWEDACREWDAAANNHDYYRTLVIRVERVWSDLEDWVNKHLRPLQVESFTLLFANYFDQEAQGVADRPWQLAVDALDQGFARRAQVLEQQMNKCCRRSRQAGQRGLPHGAPRHGRSRQERPRSQSRLPRRTLPSPRRGNSSGGHRLRDPGLRHRHIRHPRPNRPRPRRRNGRRRSSRQRSRINGDRSSDKYSTLRNGRGRGSSRRGSDRSIGWNRCCRRRGSALPEGCPPGVA